MPAGAYRLEVWPEIDDSLEPDRQAHWLPTELELRCPPSSSQRVRVPLRQGGRVAFHVQEVGEAGAGSWFLRGPDAEGPLWLLTWDLEQASTRTVYTPHQVDGAGEYWLHRALLPGEYHLEVTLGGELRTFPFSVSAGGAADVFLEP